MKTGVAGGCRYVHENAIGDGRGAGGDANQVVGHEAVGMHWQQVSKIEHRGPPLYWRTMLCLVEAPGLELLTLELENRKRPPPRNSI